MCLSHHRVRKEPAISFSTSCRLGRLPTSPARADFSHPFLRGRPEGPQRMLGPTLPAIVRRAITAVGAREGAGRADMVSGRARLTGCRSRRRTWQVAADQAQGLEITAATLIRRHFGGGADAARGPRRPPGQGCKPGYRRRAHARRAAPCAVHLDRHRRRVPARQPTASTCSSTPCPCGSATRICSATRGSPC